MGINFRKKIAMLVSKRVPASQGIIFNMETGDNKVCKNSRGAQRAAPSLTDRSTSISRQKDDTVITRSRYGKGKENIVNNGEKKRIAGPIVRLHTLFYWFARVTLSLHR